MCAKAVYLLMLFVSVEAIFKECKNVPNGTFVPSMEQQHDCLSYVFCDGENSFQDDCPTNTYFNKEQQACDIDDNFVCEENVSNKKNNNNEKESQTTTTETHKQEHLLPSKPTVTSNVSTTTVYPKCNHDSNALFAHENRCEYYYKCFNGYLTVLRCEFGSGWDYKKQKCLRIAEAQCFHSN